MMLTDSNGKLNFNALAWEAPKHGDEYGYTPDDKYYQEICDWLSTGATRWKTRTNNITTVRKSFEDSIYDVVVTFNHTTKMISWIFRKCYEYAV